MSHTIWRLNAVDQTKLRQSFRSVSSDFSAAPNLPSLGELFSTPLKLKQLSSYLLFLALKLMDLLFPTNKLSPVKIALLDFFRSESLLRDPNYNQEIMKSC